MKIKTVWPYLLAHLLNFLNLVNIEHRMLSANVRINVTKNAAENSKKQKPRNGLNKRQKEKRGEGAQLVE